MYIAILATLEIHELTPVWGTQLLWWWCSCMKWHFTHLYVYSKLECVVVHTSRQLWVGTVFLHILIFWTYHNPKPSLSCQWSHVWSFIRYFFCISFVWLYSQSEVSQTKLMQMKSRTKLPTRLIWVERLGSRLILELVWTFVLGFPFRFCSFNIKTNSQNVRVIKVKRVQFRCYKKFIGLWFNKIFPKINIVHSNCNHPKAAVLREEKVSWWPFLAWRNLCITHLWPHIGL